jgi:hypothetical protein
VGEISEEVILYVDQVFITFQPPFEEDSIYVDSSSVIVVLTMEHALHRFICTAAECYGGIIACEDVKM